MIYNEGQLNAINTIVSFINKPPQTTDDYFITLEGFAGTGKSTIIKEIISKLNNKKIVVSAPTHKAKKVISKFTDLKAETIQALLGLRPNTDLADFNHIKPQFDVKAEEKIQNYDVLFIDETSMLPYLLKKLIEEKAIVFHVKVIYMGDKLQTPPVGEKVSKVFLNKNRVELNEIVRQSNENPNQELIEIARNDVRDRTDNFLSFIKNTENKINNKGEGFFIQNQEDYYNSLLDNYFDNSYKDNIDLVKILTWKNASAKKINAFIRRKIINSDELVAVGDILTGYNTISKELPKPPYYVNIVENSVDYIVTDVIIEERSICSTIIKGYRTYVKDNAEPIFILHKDSYSDFREELKRRLEIAKTGFGQWKQYYTFKNQIILMEPFYNGKGHILVDKDIDYGYAITVHKSQGSTYENVGINVNDIMQNCTPNERRSLLYVAVSRTSKVNRLYAK